MCRNLFARDGGGVARKGWKSGGEEDRKRGQETAIFAFVPLFCSSSLPDFGFDTAAKWAMT
jgi:hypothetical protein